MLSNKPTPSLLILLTFVVLSSSTIMIYSPPSLIDYFKQKYQDQGNKIPYSLANYGDIPYGKILAAEVRVSSVLQNCIYDQIEAHTKSTGLFVLSSRGDCSFTQKSLNAQKEGAKAAIIMDSRAESPNKIVMVDDGRGNTVLIPTILITKEDGDQIVSRIVKGQTVAMGIVFDTNRRDKASMDIWLSASDRRDYMFIRSFKPYYDRIKQNVTLNVYYGTFPCQKCLESDCYSDHQYCQAAFGNWGVQNVGQLVIKEQIRQQLIFAESEQAWWRYTNSFDEECIDWAVSEQCSKTIMRNVGVNEGQINKKLEQTFTDNYKNNTLLAENEVKRKQAHVFLYPSIIINDMVYQGNLQAPDVFQMLCNSIHPPPDACYPPSKTSSHVSIWAIVVPICIAFLVFLIILGVCIRKYLRRRLSKDINAQVNELVNQYITMYENQRFNAPKTSADPQSATSTN